MMHMIIFLKHMQILTFVKNIVPVTYVIRNAFSVFKIWD